MSRPRPLTDGRARPTNLAVLMREAFVALNDLAPTLATLVSVENPSGSSGRVLAEALTPATPARQRGTQ